MDTIQKVLIKAGHKDLAQEYYKKVAKSTTKYNFGNWEFYFDGEGHLEVSSNKEIKIEKDKIIFKTNSDALKQMKNLKNGIDKALEIILHSS